MSVSKIEGTGLFAESSYVGWYRELLEQLRAGETGNLLFDTSILEPKDRLYADARRALDPDSARFDATSGWGSAALVAAVARRYGVDERAILTTTGCRNALSHIYSAYLSQPSHVIIESPYFDLLTRIARNHSAELSLLPREPGTFAIDPQRLEALIRPATRLIVLTNLHNPSGAFLDEAALLEIARVANRKGVTVVVDEVYGDFVPRTQRARPAAALDACFISINSLTKVYGLSALKCGWIIADESRMTTLRPVYAELEWGSSVITHGIGSLVLDEIEPYEAYWKNALERNRPLLMQSAAVLRAEELIEGAVPHHGCMYFPKVVGVSDTRKLAAWMWDRYRLVLAPGEFFGAAGHVRIGFGQPHAAFAEGIARFGEALRRYRSEGRGDV
jgi:aspartate/methionine/tyrosine aminotransferase